MVNGVGARSLSRELRSQSGPSCRELETNSQKLYKRMLELTNCSDPKLCRYDVDFATSFHTWAAVEEGVKMHMVLKFYYSLDLLPFIGIDKSEIDAAHDGESGTVIRRGRGGCGAWFPYCFFNALSEEHISWSIQKSKDGRSLYERIEMYATVAMSCFADNFPFVLRILPIKIGVDGLAETHRINLKPKMSSNGQPDWNIQLFLRKTSEFQLMSTHDAYAMMLASADSDEIQSGRFFTRGYQLFFFNCATGENLLKFIGISTCIFFLFSFYPAYAMIDEETYTVEGLVGAASTAVLADVALLFVVPDEGGFTVAEKVIVLHCLMIVVVTAVLCPGYFDQWWHLAVTDLCVLSLTTALVLRGYMQFYRTKHEIKKLIDTQEGHTDFDEIDRLL